MTGNPTAQQILQGDRKWLWHPFTQMKDYEAMDPLVITKAKGNFLYGPQGQRYYDTIASWWTNVHGHCHPWMTKRVHQQLKTLDHVNFSGFTHGPAVELVSRLAEHLPASLNKFFYSDNGSTAVEVALKMAFQFFQNQGVTGKTRFMYLENSYHGDTLGAMSLSDQGDFSRPFSPLLFQALKAPQPCRDCAHANLLAPSSPPCGETCFAETEKLLEAHRHELAAVIVEPLIQCVGGMWVYSPEYLTRLVKKAQSLGILVIFDEVATGFGRTGSLFAMDQISEKPDIVCLSKGLTGGTLPLALTVCTQTIYQAFYDDYAQKKTLYHGHSYTANPVACSAGIASLELFEKNRVLERLPETVQHFRRSLLDTWARPYVGALRHLGMIGAVDLVGADGAPFSPSLRMGRKVYLRSLEKGLVLRPLGDTVYWMLPLSMKSRDISRVLELSRQTVEEVLRENRC